MLFIEPESPRVHRRGGTGDSRGTVSSGLPDGASPRTPEAAASAVPPFELDEVSILELQRRMDSGQETARSIAEKYLRRIEEIDGQGTGAPCRHRGQSRSPRHRRFPGSGAAGVWCARTAARHPHPDQGQHRHGRPDDDHRRFAGAGGYHSGTGLLRGAEAAGSGAVLLGKTNLSEWANFRSTRSTSGWSGRGGLTRNPYALDRNPCGSSSGSGVAASASLCSAAIGTETDGSIVCPSTANGIVGIKPTVGLVSRTGIIPISHSQDTAGPMARTVADAVAVLGA